MSTDRSYTLATVRRSFRRRLWHRDDAPAAMIDALWRDPDTLLASGRPLKEGDRTTVVRLDAGDLSHVLKRYNLKNVAHTATHLVLPSRAGTCRRNAERLLAAGLQTPAPVAVLEERFGALRTRSFLVTQHAAGRTLLQILSDDRTTQAQIEALADAFGHVWRVLGGLRAGHGDMKASNFIVDAENRITLIDLDGMRFHYSGSLLRRARRRDLARFMRNWAEPGVNPAVAAAFRARIDTT